MLNFPASRLGYRTNSVPSLGTQPRCLLCRWWERNKRLPRNWLVLLREVDFEWFADGIVDIKM